jgi:hypothetical protein
MVIGGSALAFPAMAASVCDAPLCADQAQAHVGESPPVSAYISRWNAANFPMWQSWTADASRSRAGYRLFAGGRRSS